MDAHEFAEKLRNKQGTYDELLKWCEETVDNMDLNNPDYQYLYDRAIRYMMQGRITQLTEKEATIMTKYLSKLYMHEKGLDDRIKVNVLEWEEFVKRHKSDKLNGMCTTLKGTRFILDYSPNVIEGLMSGNINKFLDALKTIYHETAHVIQESSIAPNLKSITKKIRNVLFAYWALRKIFSCLYPVLSWNIPFTIYIKKSSGHFF